MRYGILLLLLLTACGQPSIQLSTSLEISGTVKIASNDVKPSRNEPVAVGDFVPGEVIVRFKPAVSLQSLSRLSINGVNLQRVQSLGISNTYVYKAATDKTGTLELMKALEARADVLWVQPNIILQGASVPNDKLYPKQWHYKAINLPQAWDIETGTSNPVTVAVVDSGILSKHPDFVGKLLPGYDFIHDPEKSLDGDGPDPDPEDPGDHLYPTKDGGYQSTYHGSHIAGTIAAATNNTTGVAGVSWGAKILPVRVLGKGNRGTLSDILNGLLWAAGIKVPGVPNNSNPAQIINFSVGALGSCGPAYQEVIGQIMARGSMLVVAAMNENQDVASWEPANCPGVIAVGATDALNQRAEYSNFGQRIDLMAPGGDTDFDLDHNGDPDGILSTLKSDSTGAFEYWFYSGTSMAAPHVAGVLALMKSMQPNLTGSQAVDILKRTAHPLSNRDCTGQGPSLSSSACGAGLIDAYAALKALQNPTPLGLKGTFVFACWPVGDSCDAGRSKEVQLEDETQSAAYVLADLEPGSYQILAWKDMDGDGRVSVGDYAGGYTGVVSPPAGGIDLEVSPILGLERASLLQNRFGLR